MVDLLPQITNYWHNKRDSLISDATNMTNRLVNRHKSKSNNSKLSSSVLENTYNRFVNSFDEKYGGFGKAPKFPKPHDYKYTFA